MDLTIKLVRQLCKKCRNDAYRNKPNGKPGMWIKNSFSDAYWPAGEGPYRKKYKDNPNSEKFCFIRCPGPVVSDWISEYFIPKIYRIIMNNSDLTRDEHEFVEIGLNSFEAKFRLDKYTSFNPINSKNPIRSGKWKELFHELLKFDFSRLEIGSITNTKIYCFNEPPIWCPYKKEHKGEQK